MLQFLEGMGWKQEVDGERALGHSFSIFYRFQDCIPLAEPL
jgi:hypothetical protein